ncbi:MAG TPA: hypothetical protein VMU65_10645 [Candidatus Saccharimonadales bacterium]|nr:hypothetical protein [Candidatus Saccharimonadales bacterium]
MKATRFEPLTMVLDPPHFKNGVYLDPELSVSAVLTERRLRVSGHLRSVEEEADPLILALLRQVYGEKWLKPFVTILDA